MHKSRSTIGIVSLVSFAGVAVSFLILREGNKTFAENQIQWLKNKDRLTHLTTEYHRLSSGLQPSINNLAPATKGDELRHLEKDAEHLRRRRDELANESEVNPLFQGDATAFVLSSRKDYRWKKVVSDSDSEEYKEKLFELASASPNSKTDRNPRNVGQELGAAVRKYAREHGGQFPKSFNDAADYLDGKRPLPEAQHFELVFHGATNELNGIPHQAVALIRQRNAWLTPAGKLARIYIMADGLLRIVESEDNFASWETDHIIPASSMVD